MPISLSPQVELRHLYFKKQCVLFKCLLISIFFLGYDKNSTESNDQIENEDNETDGIYDNVNY